MTDRGMEQSVPGASNLHTLWQVENNAFLSVFCVFLRVFHVYSRFLHVFRTEGVLFEIGYSRS